jgi:hypothetical protein
MQHLGTRRFHARSLSCGEDNDTQWHKWILEDIRRFIVIQRNGRVMPVTSAQNKELEFNGYGFEKMGRMPHFS